MKYLFSLTGLRIIESLTLTKTLYAFDFDGTLAPIVRTPEMARATESTSNLVKALSAHVPVAIISGRSIADLKKHLNFTPDHMIGNHGLEGLSLRQDSATQAQATCQTWRKQLERKWGFDSGVFIEDKTYSIALHYRNSRSKKNARIALFERIEKLDPAPRLVLGKCVMNLIPAGAPHKGVALLELMMKLGLTCAFYIGDDDTDEDVFSLPDDRIVTTRVGKKKTSQAQFFLKRQSEVNLMLKEMLKQVQRCQGPK